MSKNFRLVRVRNEAFDAGGETPVTEYLHLDHLGSVRMVTDAMNDEVVYHEYFPFGVEATAVGLDDTKLKFTGHERDNGPGSNDQLDYMHARYCGPVLGRFLSVDPVDGDPSSPLTWNRYSLVNLNPQKFVDPTGEEPLDSTVAAFLGDYFGQDVSGVKVFGGPVSRFVTWLLRAEAVTLGQSVLFRRTAWAEYQNQSPDGIALAAHEVRHTLQYSEYGFFGFLGKYIAQAIRAGGDPLKMPLEIVGYLDFESVKALLKSNPELLESIQNRTYQPVSATIQPTSSGWVQIQSLGGGVFGGLSSLYSFQGTIYIDGINVSGVFSPSSRFE